MLTDSEKLRIREEEIYREEVKNELSKNSKCKNSIFSFLDTQHGIFISSAIILPLCIWLFTVLQIHYSNTQVKTSHIEKLDHEITLRVSNNIQYLDRGGLDQFKTQIDSFSVYPQFSGIKVQGLMLELEKIVSKEERNNIAEARNVLISGNEQEVRQKLKIRSWYEE